MRQRSGASTQLVARGGQLLYQLRTEALGKEIQNIPLLCSFRPVLLSVYDFLDRILTPYLPNIGNKLCGMGRSQAAMSQQSQVCFGDIIPVAVNGITQHMPASGRGKGLLRLRWLSPQVIGTGADVVVDVTMDIVLRRPFQPDAAVCGHFHMEHPVQQRRGHGPGNGIILCTVASADDDRPLWQMIIENEVSRLFNAVGSQGVAEKYGYVLEEDVVVAHEEAEANTTIGP